jgi:hypothetical protein
MRLKLISAFPSVYAPGHSRWSVSIVSSVIAGGGPSPETFGIACSCLALASREWRRELHAAIIFARADFVNVHVDKMADRTRWLWASLVAEITSNDIVGCKNDHDSLIA